MSIGDALAQARRQAGLTISQVSQRTCIRETIIRGIERGDFSACGGDFYARGHVRSIARAVGADPDALVHEYDLAHGPPQAIAAADVFEPSTPIRLKERRRRPNWSAAMALALAVIVGFVVYQAWPSSGVSKVAAQGAGSPAPRHTARRTAQPSPKKHHHPGSSRQVAIHLTAIEDCWVQLHRGLRQADLQRHDPGRHSQALDRAPGGQPAAWQSRRYRADRKRQERRLAEHLRPASHAQLRARQAYGRLTRKYRVRRAAGGHLPRAAHRPTYRSLPVCHRVRDAQAGRVAPSA